MEDKVSLPRIPMLFAHDKSPGELDYLDSKSKMQKPIYERFGVLCNLFHV